MAEAALDVAVEEPASQPTQHLTADEPRKAMEEEEKVQDPIQETAPEAAVVVKAMEPATADTQAPAVIGGEQLQQTAEEEKAEQRPQLDSMVTADAEPAQKKKPQPESEAEQEPASEAMFAFTAAEAEEQLTAEQQKAATALLYGDSDSEDEGDAAMPLPATRSSLGSSSADRPPPPPAAHNPYLQLEQQIEKEDRQEREYHIPHLSALTFVTPPVSEPSTPAAAPAFHLDTTLRLTPDSQSFASSSLPLLFPKLALTLSSPSTPLPIKLSALRVCIDLARRPEHLLPLLSHQVVDELIISAAAASEELRTAATQALVEVVQAREGREYGLSAGLVGRMPALLIDQCVQVRLNGAEALRRLTVADSRLLFAAPVSAAAGDAASELGFLIRRVERDSDIGVKTLLLRCIRPALRTRDGLVIARYNGILAVLRSIIGDLKLAAAASSSSSSSVSSSPSLSALLRAIADVLTGVAEEDEGKDDIVSHQLHLAVMRWVDHPQPAVRRAAVSALAQTSVGVKGKHACVRDGCVELCVRRVKGEEQDTDVLSALLQWLANLVESRRAKEQLAADEELRARVQAMADRPRVQSLLSMSAASALYKLNWQP